MIMDTLTKRRECSRTGSILTSATLLFFCSFLLGCAEKTEPNISEVSSSNIKLPTLGAVAQSRTIDPSSLILTVLVNGESVQMEPNGNRDQWNGKIEVVRDAALTLSINWSLDNRVIASYEQALEPLTNDRTHSFSDADYVTDFDDDADGFSNLIEFSLSTDPSDETSTPMDIDMVIPRAQTKPVLDGQYEDVWDSATYFKIDNLITDRGAVLPDGNTPFKFGALHDGEYLYLLGLGEQVDNATLHADSNEATFDDAMGFALDPDGGRGWTGADANDLQWIIPLLKRATAEILGYSNDSIQPAMVGGERVAGDLHIFQRPGNLREIALNQAGLIQLTETEYLFAMRANNSNDSDDRVKLEHGRDVEMKFANCKCINDQHAYEVKINLAEAGIVLGQQFGLEVFMMDDVDGGVSDASYNWKLTNDDFVTGVKNIGAVVLE